MSPHPLDDLADRGKEPPNARAFQTWLSVAAKETGVAPARLNRTVANAILISSLQRVVSEDGQSRFLVKGGVHMELRLGLGARASRDLDTLFRGAFEEMLDVLDQTLREGWGPLTLTRTDVEDIEVPGRRVNPRRLTIKIGLHGRTALTAQLEVSPDEGGAGDRAESLALPRLRYFGIETPEQAAVLAVEYQVGQKLHACTDPHGEVRPNLRVHDLADLWMLRGGCFPDGSELSELRRACVAIFEARADDAAATEEVKPRKWPPIIVAHPPWADGWEGIRADLVDVALDEVIAELNAWILEIDSAG